MASTAVTVSKRLTMFRNSRTGGAISNEGKTYWLARLSLLSRLELLERIERFERVRFLVHRAACSSSANWSWREPTCCRDASCRREIRCLLAESVRAYREAQLDN